MDSISALRIAVLINTPPETQFWEDVRQSYIDVFDVVAPGTQVGFYDPVLKREFPKPQNYDLIIFSGGKADASSSEPWVLEVLKFIRTVPLESPRTKLLGICWGHQAVARAFGGKVTAVPNGPIAAIEDIPLTDAGKKFFTFANETGTFRAPQFHVRQVTEPAPGFIHLAYNHECFINEANTILSFQAHPEVQRALAKKLLLEEDKVYNGNYSAQEIELEVQKLDQPMDDGMNLLKRIIRWLNE